MTTYESVPNPRQHAEQVLTQSQSVLREAVSIAFPERPDINPVEAFPKPSEVRAESPDIPELTDDRKAALLTKASELGFGRAENVTLSEQGFVGATVIVEGGQPHKMLAEARMVVDDEAAQPKIIIISASPHRELKNDAEIASAQRLFGRVGKTEYDVASDVVRALDGFIEYDEPRVLNAGYDINDGFAFSQEPTGQFEVIGEINSTPVVLMKINRRDLEDGKYDRQPNTAAVIGIVNALTKANNDESSPLVHVTSGTYRPSRTVGAAIAGLTVDRLVGIATYGNDLLNEIKGDNAPAPISQLPGELREMAVQVENLRAALSS